MMKILFVCLGNICRSPMAEFVFKELVHREGLDSNFAIQSAGTDAEVGHGVYSLAKQELAKHHIFCDEKVARQLVKKDYLQHDYILAMESKNVQAIYGICGQDSEQKVKRLLEFTGRAGDIADPWYTRNFEITYRDIEEGCTGFLQYLKSQNIF